MSFQTLEKLRMSEEVIACPQCKSEYTYPTGVSMMCSECGYEWSPEQLAAEEAESNAIKDANGNILQDGDTVVVVKDCFQVCASAYFYHL